MQNYEFTVVEENRELINFLKELIGRNIKKVELFKYCDDMQAIEFKITDGIEIDHLSYYPESLSDVPLWVIDI